MLAPMQQKDIKVLPGRAIKVGGVTISLPNDQAQLVKLLAELQEKQRRGLITPDSRAATAFGGAHRPAPVRPASQSSARSPSPEGRARTPLLGTVGSDEPHFSYLVAAHTSEKAGAQRLEDYIAEIRARRSLLHLADEEEGGEDGRRGYSRGSAGVETPPAPPLPFPKLDASRMKVTATVAVQRVQVGSWQYISKRSGDVALKFDFAHRLLSWRLRGQSVVYRCDVPSGSLAALHLSPVPGAESYAVLSLDLLYPCRFFKASARGPPPQAAVGPASPAGRSLSPLKEGGWEECADFTAGEAGRGVPHFLLVALEEARPFVEAAIRADDGLRYRMAVGEREGRAPPRLPGPLVALPALGPVSRATAATVAAINDAIDAGLADEAEAEASFAAEAAAARRAAAASRGQLRAEEEPAAPEQQPKPARRAGASREAAVVRVVGSIPTPALDPTPLSGPARRLAERQKERERQEREGDGYGSWWARVGRPGSQAALWSAPPAVEPMDEPPPARPDGTPPIGGGGGAGAASAGVMRRMNSLLRKSGAISRRAATNLRLHYTGQARPASNESAEGPEEPPPPTGVAGAAKAMAARAAAPKLQGFGAIAIHTGGEHEEQHARPGTEGSALGGWPRPTTSGESVPEREEAEQRAEEEEEDAQAAEAEDVAGGLEATRVAGWGEGGEEVSPVVLAAEAAERRTSSRGSGGSSARNKARSPSRGSAGSTRRRTPPAAASPTRPSSGPGFPSRPLSGPALPPRPHSGPALPRAPQAPPPTDHFPAPPAGADSGRSSLASARSAEKRAADSAEAAPQPEEAEPEAEAEEAAEQAQEPAAAEEAAEPPAAEQGTEPPAPAEAETAAPPSARGRPQERPVSAGERLAALAAAGAVAAASTGAGQFAPADFLGGQFGLDGRPPASARLEEAARAASAPSAPPAGGGEDASSARAASPPRAVKDGERPEVAAAARAARQASADLRKWLGTPPGARRAKRLKERERQKRRVPSPPPQHQTEPTLGTLAARLQKARAGGRASPPPPPPPLAPAAEPLLPALHVTPAIAYGHPEGAAEAAVQGTYAQAVAEAVAEGRVAPHEAIALLDDFLARRAEAFERAAAGVAPSPAPRPQRRTADDRAYEAGEFEYAPLDVRGMDMHGKATRRIRRHRRSQDGEAGTGPTASPVLSRVPTFTGVTGNAAGPHRDRRALVASPATASTPPPDDEPLPPMPAEARRPPEELQRERDMLRRRRLTVPGARKIVTAPKTKASILPRYGVDWLERRDEGPAAEAREPTPAAAAEDDEGRGGRVLRVDGRSPAPAALPAASLLSTKPLGRTGPPPPPPPPPPAASPPRPRAGLPVVEGASLSADHPRPRPISPAPAPAAPPAPAGPPPEGEWAPVPPGAASLDAEALLAALRASAPPPPPAASPPRTASSRRTTARGARSRPDTGEALGAATAAVSAMAAAVDLSLSLEAAPEAALPWDRPPGTAADPTDPLFRAAVEALAAPRPVSVGSVKPWSDDGHPEPEHER